ncbi:hypothetical protein DUI87_11480 [Hirundo rustica rustica]|uniref:Protein FAM160B1 n=1 Tax=Hirundo rustica rustica TaxID=333673 RepID=A0A3M0KFK1_HIRRU|nr:hypothetical protein DUI87_11480 [Hirundo rustica rustica]
MFSKFTSILQHAVEALAPSLPLQEDFVYHWKAITHYYIETSDDKAPVTDTNIPSHLEQMLDILVQEENERESGETGPCMEYLLHHKILETLYTLGKADKLIRLCGEVLATPTENEEIQFLCIVCAKLKQDPYLVNFFLEGFYTSDFRKNFIQGSQIHLLKVLFLCNESAIRVVIGIAA